MERVEGVCDLRGNPRDDTLNYRRGLQSNQILIKEKMMKPGKTFKLSKTVKRMMALMGGPKAGRDQYKRMMIQAELAAAIQPKREKTRGPTSDR